MLFIGHTKRPSKHKRHILSLAGIVDAFLNNDHRSFTIFAGKASPECHAEKKIIWLINKVSQLTKLCILLPNYNVSVAQKIVPSVDLAEHLSLPGSEAGGTSQIKYMMNGTITIGSKDGKNLEIEAEVNDQNIFIFDETELLTDEMKTRVDLIEEFFRENLGLTEQLSSAVYGYLSTLDKIKNTYFEEKEKWQRMSVQNTIASAKFCSDESVKQYCKMWQVEPCPLPTTNPKE